MTNPLAPFLAWINKNLSNDNTSSNSRVLQSIIVFNVVPMLWVILARADWKMSDNVRLVILCLIGSGAGGYIANKFCEKDG